MCPYLTLMMFKRLYFQGSSFRSPQVTLHWEGVLTLDFPRSLYWHLVPFFSLIITFHGSICNYEGKKYYSLRGKGIIGSHPTHCCQVLGFDIKGQSRLAGNLQMQTLSFLWSSSFVSMVHENSLCHVMNPKESRQL